MIQFHIAGELHNECAYFRLRARNYANNRQGYRTVKFTARRAAWFEISIGV
jgi:hypothetical protein